MTLKPDPRTTLDELITKSGSDYLAISRMIGRNAAYIQQYIKRGIPRKLAEDDRRKIAAFLGVDEQVIGAPPPPVGPGNAFVPVKRFDVAASAGPGALVDGDLALDAIGFSAKWLRALGCKADDVSLISVKGESMEPTLSNGDDILVDRRSARAPVREGIYVIRIDDAIYVKRLVPSRSGKKISVVSDNLRYPTLKDADPSIVTVVGRVIWVGRKLN